MIKVELIPLTKRSDLEIRFQQAEKAGFLVTGFTHVPVPEGTLGQLLISYSDLADFTASKSDPAASVPPAGAQDGSPVTPAAGVEQVQASSTVEMHPAKAGNGHETLATPEVLDSRA